LAGIGAIKINPLNQNENFENTISSAVSAFEQGHYDVAIALYEEIPASVKQDISAKLQRAKNCFTLKITADDFYFNKKEYEKAKNEYEKIIIINPKDTYVENQISKCKEELQKQQIEQQKREAELKRKQEIRQPEQPRQQTASKPKPATGQLMIYSKSSYPLDIKIDGVYKGRLDSYFSSGEPFCGQDGTITAEFNSGSNHSIEATYTYEGGSTTQKTTETIIGGDCIPIPLDFSKIVKNKPPIDSSRGELVIYAKSSQQIPIDIWIDNVYKGSRHTLQKG